MENLTGGTPPVRYLPCVVPCKLYFASFKTFTQIKLLTGGGPAGATTTLMYSVYTKYNAGQIASSACYALMLFAVIFVASRIQLRFEKKMVTYQ